MLHDTNGQAVAGAPLSLDSLMTHRPTSDLASMREAAISHDHDHILVPAVQAGSVGPVEKSLRFFD